MLAEGYAAVSTRRVAKKVGPTPALVHYYFPTTDDLLVAVYRRAVERTQQRFTKAVSSSRPLRAIWSLSTDRSCTALAMEFMALANHRKVIRTEIVRSTVCFRKMQADALSNLPARGGSEPMSSPRSDRAHGRHFEAPRDGRSAGHHRRACRGKGICEGWLRRLEPGRKPRPSPSRPAGGGA